MLAAPGESRGPVGMRTTPLTATLCVCVMGGGVGWPLLTGKQHEQGTGSKVPSHVQGN